MEFLSCPTWIIALFINRFNSIDGAQDQQELKSLICDGKNPPVLTKYKD